MGVYVKGMEMPSIGTYEASIDVTNSNGKTAISVYLRDENDSRRFSVRVYETVHVPPHGRLIDADALEQEAQKRLLLCEKHGNQFQKPYEILRAINETPTVIEAEEGE